jgi:hypothetical protein
MAARLSLLRLVSSWQIRPGYDRRRRVHACADEVLPSLKGSGANFKKGRRADPGALGERESLACQIGPKFKLCTRSAGILPKLSDLGQGAIGEAIETAGAGQVGRLHKGALDDDSIYLFASG